MHHILNRNIASICVLLLICFSSVSQNNVGIGIANPHPSAILQISDSSRGVLIPKTDTNAILTYVNTLVPNPGIADGLMILDTNLNTYVYYDEAIGHWKTLIGLVGPTGPKGFQGPQGPIGPTGLSTNWRDSSGFDELVLREDTCGDWFFDAESGKIWKLWCDTFGGNEPRRWIDTLSYDNYFGELVPPDERIVVGNIDTGPGVTLQTSANDTNIVDLIPLSGAVMQITVDRDEVAYIYVAGFGTCSKAFKTSDMAYAQYEINIASASTVNFYTDRLMQHIVTIGPSGPPSNLGLDEYTGWFLAGNYYLEGPKSPFNCGPCGPFPACTSCTPLNATAVLSLMGGNRYSGSSNTTSVYLADRTTSENPGHMSVYAIIRRNPHTWPWKQ